MRPQTATANKLFCYVNENNRIFFNREKETESSYVLRNVDLSAQRLCRLSKRH